MMFANQKLSEFLLLITDEEQHSKGCLEFKNATLSLSLRRVVRADNRGVGSRSVISTDSALPSSDDTSVDNWIVACKERIAAMYKELLVDNFREKLERSMLSCELLDCLGFPLRLKSEENGVVFSNIPAKERTLYQTTAAWGRVPPQSSTDVEEGECSEAVINSSVAPDFSPVTTSLVRSDALSYLHGRKKLSIIAFDCEMCVTSQGHEVTRISVISPEFSSMVVMDTLVLPPNKITDYNTEFSGITEETMKGVTTTLTDVMKVLKEIVGPETVFGSIIIFERTI